MPLLKAKSGRGHPLRRALGAVVCLVLALAAGALRAEATPFDVIRALIHDRHYDEARIVGMALSEDGQIRARNLAFIDALILKHQGELAEAARRMRIVLAENPGYARVRHELAHTLYLMGDMSGARHHFEFLARTTDIEIDRSLYDRYLMSLQTRRPWSFSLSLGLAASTNINDGSRSDIVYIGGVPFLNENTEKSGNGISYRLSGAYRFDLGERLALTVGSGATGASYRDSAFDRTRLESFSELAMRRGRWNLGAGAMAGRMLTGWSGHRWSYGPYVSARRDFGSRGVLAARLSWTRQRYDVLSSFNGSETGIALRYRRAITPRLALTAGLSAAYVDTARDFSTHTQISPDLSADYALNRLVTLHGNVSYARAAYRGNFPLEGRPREDDRIALVAAATATGLTYRGFAPRVSYGYHDVRSNIELYARRRHSLTVLLTRRY
jgi:outer membrane protein